MAAIDLSDLGMRITNFVQDGTAATFTLDTSEAEAALARFRVAVVALDEAWRALPAGIRERVEVKVDVTLIVEEDAP